MFFENPRLRLNLPRRIGTRGRTRGRRKSVLRPVEGFVARHVEAHPKKQDARARLYTQEPRRCRSSVAFGFRVQNSLIPDSPHHSPFIAWALK